ncbi:hypothetical protein BHE74_00047585 [Ensete ventricosum]|nr:hypothetical protein BHE74_00047585 [Ensete ventricosum]
MPHASIADVTRATEASARAALPPIQEESTKVPKVHLHEGEDARPRKKPSRCLRDKESAKAIEADPTTGRTPRPHVMKDLCQTWPRREGEPFQALHMTNLPEGQPSALLLARWPSLTKRVGFGWMVQLLQSSTEGYSTRPWQTSFLGHRPRFWLIRQRSHWFG